MKHHSQTGRFDMSKEMKVKRTCRMPVLAVGVISAIFALSVPQAAHADERTDRLVVSGNWVAAAHRPSMVSAPDVCWVAELQAGVAIRADKDDVAVRVFNDAWSLPINVDGTVVVSVSDWKVTLDIAGNSSDSVDAIITKDDLLPMFAAMDKASTMTVIVGKARPLIVSLAGSTRATDAFRTCAGINSNSKHPGGNPFQ